MFNKDFDKKHDKKSVKDMLSYKNRTHMPMWLQLTVAISVIAFICVCIITGIYYRNIRTELTASYLDSNRKLINSEANNLDSYMNELSTYSVQGCYDNSYMRIIERPDKLTPYDETYMSDQIKIYFYSRSDILEYNLFLLNSGMSFKKTVDTKRIPTDITEDISSTDYYKMCISSPTFDGVTVSDNKNALFDYYHALLHIKSKSPMAITKLSVDMNIWDELAGNHNNPGEILCLLSDDSTLIRCSDDTVFSEYTDDEIQRFFNTLPTGDKTVKIGKNSYYVTMGKTAKRGLILYSFTPVNVLYPRLSAAAHRTILSAFVFLIIVLVILYCLVRSLLRPLSELSHDMTNVGEGDMSLRSNASGSMEIVTLTASFNEMLDQLEELIHKNYVYRINEQKSHIVALEAQINPHYLYNTLQAISTEALINDQMKIYKMIDALASGLRYSIKEEALVPLEREMLYTENYIYLQKLRMNDKLTVETSIDEATKNILIPKISIQMLVENSIIHGIGKTKDSITVKVTTLISDNLLCIKVWDNGEGFSSTALAKYRDIFENISPNPDTIGLANIASRLKIMYEDKARIDIESFENDYTEVSIYIPINTVKPADSSAR